MGNLLTSYASMDSVLINKFVSDAIMLWATMDPLGTLSIFATLTASLPYSQRKQVAKQATLYAGIVLVGSILLGQLILTGMGIHMGAMQIAGGLILFLFGLQMIFTNHHSGAHSESGHNIAVYPLAIPSIASPGAIMAVIMLTNNNNYSIPVQIGTTVILLIELLITYLLLISAHHILRVIGNNGALILVKVMGILLAALSVELVLDGLGVHVSEKVHI